MYFNRHYKVITGLSWFHYQRVALEHRLPNEVSEVEGVGHQGHPAEEVGDAQHPQTLPKQNMTSDQSETIQRSCLSK